MGDLEGGTRFERSLLTAPTATIPGLGKKGISLLSAENLKVIGVNDPTGVMQLAPSLHSTRGGDTHVSISVHICRIQNRL
jgi:hypothetical protein